jgi:hypothetical protein
MFYYHGLSSFDAVLSGSDQDIIAFIGQSREPCMIVTLEAVRAATLCCFTTRTKERLKDLGCFAPFLVFIAETLIC